MIKFLLRGLLSMLVALPLLAGAAQANNQEFVLGKDYQIIQATTAPATPLPAGKIQVLEFFSYGCPWCFRFEPVLEQWLKTKPKDVEFDRVPVVFEQGWDTLAKAYYTAKGLGVADKMTPVIFDALQVQGQDLINQDNLAKLFAQNGVSESDFNSAFNFSPGIDAQMMRGENLMGVYRVFEIPTLVIHGKYRVNMGMVKGDSDRMIQIANYLINKVRQENAKKKA